MTMRQHASGRIEDMCQNAWMRNTLRPALSTCLLCCTTCATLHDSNSNDSNSKAAQFQIRNLLSAHICTPLRSRYTRRG